MQSSGSGGRISNRVVPRGGISLKQMSAPQRGAAMKLLATILSPMGHEKVNEIRQADDDFKANGSRRDPRGRGSRPPMVAPPAKLSVGVGQQRRPLWSLS
jgi:hypothetical protein